MATFEKVAPLVVAIEGEKETDYPEDHGGETRYGISKRTYPNVDIASLTEPEALAILERDYWKMYGLERIDNQGIANQVFFTIVNMGPSRATQIIQVAINACGRGIVTVKIDCVMGTRTIQAINALADGWLSNRIRLETISFYLQLTDKDPTQDRFFRGWVRRALRQ